MPRITTHYPHRKRSVSRARALELVESGNAVWLGPEDIRIVSEQERVIRQRNAAVALGYDRACSTLCTSPRQQIEILRALPVVGNIAALYTLRTKRKARP